MILNLFSSIKYLNIHTNISLGNNQFTLKENNYRIFRHRLFSNFKFNLFHNGNNHNNNFSQNSLI